MKKLGLQCMMLCLILGLSACTQAESSSQAMSAQAESAPAQVESAPAQVESVPAGEAVQSEMPQAGGVAILYTDFSNGGASGGPTNTQQYELPYEGTLTVEILADGLSELTGLDFFINSATMEGNAVTVDWATDSTLIANLDDREQKEDFFFFDADSLRWFMMDSLWMTIRENMGVNEVYYTMNGGEALSYDSMPAGVQFDVATPYMGSGFILSSAAE